MCEGRVRNHINSTTTAPNPATVLLAAADKLSETVAFTRHLLPNQYDYTLIEQALRDLAAKLNPINDAL